MANLNKLYDRDSERIKILDFLTNFNEFLLLEGPSGSGKSALIEFMLKEHKDINKVLQFSLKDSKTYTLDEYLIKTYQEHRKPNLLNKFNENFNLSFAMSFSGFPSIGFGQKNSTSVIVNDDFLTQYLKVLKKDNIEVLYISNLELAEDREKRIIYKLIEKKNLPIKIIFEIGTLVDNKEILKFIKSKINNIVHIKQFDSENTKNLYKFLYKKAPPPNIYAKTDGNSFAIVHFNNDSNSLIHSFEDIVNEKIKTFDNDTIVLLIFLYLFNGNVNKSLFKNFIDNNSMSNIRYTNIIPLLQVKEIIVLDNNNIRFKHIYFQRYFDNLTIDVIDEYKVNIYNFLEKKYNSTLDYLLSFELAKLSYEIGNMNNFIKYAKLSLIKSYNNQDYSITIQVTELLLLNKNILEEKTYAWSLFIYLQTSLLLGNGQELEKYIDKGVLLKYFTPIELDLILSLILYHDNKFDISKKLLSKIIINLTDLKSKYLPLALSIQASNLIALGDINEAKNYYIDAARFFEQNDHESLFELKRLSPRIEGFIIGELVLKEIINTYTIKNYQYLEKKCLHNLAMCLLMQGKLEEAEKFFLMSYKFFEHNQSPETTYTLNGLALCSIANNEFEKARELLFDALNLCHEQYDKSTIYNNLGALSMINEDFNEAYIYCTKAEDVLNNEHSPLNDPIISHRIYHNLWLISYELQNQQKLSKYQKLANPPQLYFYDERLLKYNILKNKILKNEKIEYITKKHNNSLEWTVKNFNCTFSKLSFYDFNFKIIKTIKNIF